MSELYDIFMQHDDRIAYKWEQYFDVYEKYFQPFKNKKITILEIGVMEGGSLQIWKKYFGEQATIIGIDINPDTFFSEDQIHIEIGDQSNHVFLESVISKFGVPDIVLDDGSHDQSHIKSSFMYLYPQMKSGSIYFVEDLHTSYWEGYGGGYKNEKSFVEFSKNCIDLINAPYARTTDIPELPFDFTNTTRSICFWDACTIFTKGSIEHRRDRKIGKNTNIICQVF